MSLQKQVATLVPLSDDSVVATLLQLPHALVQTRMESLATINFDDAAHDQPPHTHDELHNRSNTWRCRKAYQLEMDHEGTLATSVNWTSQGVSERQRQRRWLYPS